MCGALFAELKLFDVAHINYFLLLVVHYILRFVVLKSRTKRREGYISYSFGVFVVHHISRHMVNMIFY